MSVFDDCRTLEELEAKRKQLINELHEQELQKWKRTVPDLCPGLNTESVERRYRRPFCICKYETGSEEPVECFIIEYSDYGKDWILYHYPSGDILETNSKKGILVSILKNIELPHYVFDAATKLFEEKYGEEYDALWDELYWQERKASESNWDYCEELYREYENITWDDFYRKVRAADRRFAKKVNMDEFFAAFPELLETFKETGQVSYSEGVPQGYKWGMDVLFDSGSSFGYYYFYYCANFEEMGGISMMSSKNIKIAQELISLAEELINSAYLPWRHMHTKEIVEKLKKELTPEDVIEGWAGGRNRDKFLDYIKRWCPEKYEKYKNLLGNIDDLGKFREDNPEGFDEFFKTLLECIDKNYSGYVNYWDHLPDWLVDMSRWSKAYWAKRWEPGEEI